MIFSFTPFKGLFAYTFDIVISACKTGYREKITSVHDRVETDP